MESRKMVLMKLVAGRQCRHRHKEQTYGLEAGEEGEGRTYGESNMETYITICKIDSQREFSVCLRELRLGLCNSGGIGREVEGGSRRSGHMCLWWIHVDVWQKPTQYYKAIILQLKRNKF